MAVLPDLCNLCPNVTSFTAFFPRSSHSDPSREVGAIVSGWTKLRTLHCCALPQSVMDQLANRKSLESLSIELNNSTSPHYVGRFSETLHQFSLGGNNAPRCTRYLESIHCSPKSCSLHVGADESTLEDIAVIELTSSYWPTPSSETFRLDITLITPLLVFHSLTTVDLDLFSSAGLDDEAFSVMAKTWPNLRRLALGTCDVSRAKPLATINALISLLTHCPNLESLHLAFDGSVPPPTEILPDVQNNHITKLQVGHSSIEDVNGIASCFGQLMPRLKKIISAKYPPYDVAKWAAVQKMLACSLRSQCIGTD
ncbi:hypothetical protein F5I97DRAFT_1924763 [Phlebopus sp. FC_14]|nr:hypothetical protein F5I97DRAFT_1924763 [Phlebopus sp. FC_14]